MPINKDFIQWIYFTNPLNLNQEDLKTKAIEFSEKFKNCDKKTVVKFIEDF